MLDNNFINQIKKYKEDLQLDVVDPKGYKQDEYTYILGNKQKQMIIDAVKEEPVGILKYYFLQASSSLEQDMELMKSCFGDRWILNPGQGYQNLKIICDDITYANKIISKELIDKIIKSIDELNEDITLDYSDEKGYLYLGKVGCGYILGTKEKLALIDWLKNLDEDTIPKISGYSDWMLDEMNNHIDGRWVLGMYWKDGDTIGLFLIDKGTHWNHYFEFPIDYIKNFILDTDIEDTIDAFKSGRIKTDEDLDISVTDNSNINILAQQLAEKIGDCEVVGNVIYQLMQDFEIYIDDEEEKEIPYGIFSIYEVLPNMIIAWNSKAETCEDVENIGIKPLEYFRGTRIKMSLSLKDFIEFLDDYFGRDWFGTYDEEEAFIDDWSGLLSEDLILEPSTIDTAEDLYNRIRYGEESITLGDAAKGEVSAWLSMEEEEWEDLKNYTWELAKNTPELDAWYDEEHDDEFPFALLIGDRFYDALSDSCAEDAINAYLHE